MDYTVTDMSDKTILLLKTKLYYEIKILKCVYYTPWDLVVVKA